MISTVDRLRLAALLGMLGSSHVGERDNAARLLEQFRRQRDLNWADLLARRPMDDPAGPRTAHWPHDHADVWTSAGPMVHPRRTRDAVWRWSMLLGLVVLGLMSLTMLARQHAMEKFNATETDGRCAAGQEAGQYPSECAPATEFRNRNEKPLEPRTALAIARTETSTERFSQGLSDRRVYQTWQKLAPPGLCSESGGPVREEWAAECVIVRRLLAQFEQRRRTDPVYRAGWNSFTPS
jgi:hypothetical protein